MLTLPLLVSVLSFSKPTPPARIQCVSPIKMNIYIYIYTHESYRYATRQTENNVLGLLRSGLWKTKDMLAIQEL